jgi:hypothetical protein
VRAALAFLRATAAYDWPAASDAAEVLVRPRRAATRGCRPGSCTTAPWWRRWPVRRPARAVRAAEVLGPVLRRRAGDVRSALFTAWITAAASTR